MGLVTCQREVDDIELFQMERFLGQHVGIDVEYHDQGLVGVTPTEEVIEGQAYRIWKLDRAQSPNVIFSRAPIEGIEYLLVGGGGSGARSAQGAGGGAGGRVAHTLGSPSPMEPFAADVVVGAGGTPGTTFGIAGTATSVTGLASAAGGPRGAYSATAPVAGTAQATGGKLGGTSGGAATTFGSGGSAGEGEDGYPAEGVKGGNGGNGILLNADGTPTMYGAGGGSIGGTAGAHGVGGIGSNAAVSTGTPTPLVEGTGAGSSATRGMNAAKASDGVVVFRVPI